MHKPHAPEVSQYGAAAVAHAFALLVPSSPAHATQVSEAASHEGVAPVQAFVLSAEHCTHVLLARSHAGFLGSVQSKSLPHCSHVSKCAPTLIAHTFERHSAARTGVQGPSPFSIPHLPSVSQAPLAQTRRPLATLHVPLIGASLGKGCPFGVFCVHVPESHHSFEEKQSVSKLHVFPQDPVTALQIDPLWLAPQSPFVKHRPHVPASKPELTQYGSKVDGQANDPLDPLSPLQPVHVSVAVLQTGVVSAHAVEFSAVHCTHDAVVMSQVSAPKTLQLESPAHDSHFPASGPLVAQTAERQTVFASPLVQGPSPFAYPHLPSTSHVLDRQSAPFPVHGPSPFAYPHFKSVPSHAPLRQTEVAVADVQTPSPFAYPHSLSESQTPL